MTSALSTRDPDSAIVLLGLAAELPPEALSAAQILEQERDRVEAQLSRLGESLRNRLRTQFGIDSLRVHSGLPSELGLRAARNALIKACVPPESVGCIIDFSTLPGDHAGVWSLANRVQAHLGCERALSLSVHGAGCAGFHLGLRTALALLRDDSSLSPCLLVASDCVAPGGRAYFPISILGDAASAAVLGIAHANERKPRVLSVECSTQGTFDNIVVADGCPVQVEIDSAALESRILPLHFVMCHRVLQRALEKAQRGRNDIRSFVYPNTTQLDRSSAARALGIPLDRFAGPGPQYLGHTFASDMLINLSDALEKTAQGDLIAMVAVGSGFCWGAALVEA